MCDTPKQPDHASIGVSDILNKLDSRVCNAFTDMLETYAFNPAKQFAIAAVVIDPDDDSKFLAVKRPSDAKSLPDVWGLPAVIVEYGEQPVIATRRLAWEKLNTQVELLGYLGLASANRGKYELTLMDVVVRLTGKGPSVQEAPTKQTKYVQQQWTNDLSILQEAALNGSICSRILLQSQGITY